MIFKKAVDGGVYTNNVVLEVFFFFLNNLFILLLLLLFLNDSFMCSFGPYLSICAKLVSRFRLWN